MAQATCFSVFTLGGLPEVAAGDDLAALILTAAAQTQSPLMPGDVVVIAQKIVSKAEGRQKLLSDVTPSPRAIELAAECSKDARLVELILGESQAVVRCCPGVLITRHRLGHVVANAAIDQSNVPGGDDAALLLPLDPDASAFSLRARLVASAGGHIGVIINDSFGRPFRQGTCGIAIGCSGVPTLVDRRGQPDRQGRILQATVIGWADEVAAAASLVMGQGAEGLPVAIVRGLAIPPDHGLASDIVRPAELDLFL